jgi:hypothetical protein
VWPRAREREEHTAFWRESDRFEDLGVDGKTVIKWILKEQGGRACTGFISCGIRTTDCLL